MHMKNEKGVTLIEVILSITILMIVFSVLINYLPQMATSNNQNIDKNLAVNLAKDELLYWKEALKNKSDFDHFINHIATKVACLDGSAENGDCYQQLFTELNGEYESMITNLDEKFQVRVKVWGTPTSTSEAVDLHQVHIAIMDEDELLKSETYGYIHVVGEDDYEE